MVGRGSQMKRMITGPSRDASHDGTATEASSDRLRCGSARELRLARHHGTQNRVPEVLRLLHLLALAIVTVVCAGIASPGRGTASLAAPIAVAAHDSAGA